MPDLSGVTDNITRKAGPLPLWGWAIAVGGAVLGYRLIKGGGSTGVSVLPTGSAGSSAGGDSGSGLPTAGDQAGTGSTPGPDTTPATNADLPPPTSYTNLLAQLFDAITKRDASLRGISDTQLNINSLTDLYRAKKTSKANYDKQMKVYNARLAGAKADVTRYSKIITDLQAALGKLGAPAT